MTTKLGRNIRKHKRRVNHLSKKIGKTRYFEDCNYHPAQVTEFDFYGPTSAYVNGTSLIDGIGTSCSLINCGPIPLTEREALDRAAYRALHGKYAYMLKYAYNGNQEALEGYIEQDKTWNFR